MMRIQYLNGGLANQVFQYIFLRFAELSGSAQDNWYFDDSFFFFNHVHNGYELKKVFRIDANLLSNYFEEDVWAEFIQNRKKGISIPQTFKDLGFSMEMIAETTNHSTVNPFNGIIHQLPANEFYPEITRYPGENIYYHSYWINTSWFRAYEDIFRKELTFPPLTDGRNQQYACQIANSNSVAVHIRRGDYVSLGWELPAEYYTSSIRSMLDTFPDAVLFIFSDDIPWCRKHADSLGLSLARQTIYVEGNTHGLNYIDLQLMTLCKELVMSNSAFCFLAALLSNTLCRCIEPPHNH